VNDLLKPAIEARGGLRREQLSWFRVAASITGHQRRFG